jgi:Spy/CpxP family protein refolding chaperone
MTNSKHRPIFYLIFSAIFILTFSNLAIANIMDSIGTGSSGSYDHSADKNKSPSMKKEGSGSKAYSKHKSYSHKKEGSGSKSHHRPKSYTHKREGSGSKYSHNKKHQHASHSKCQFTHLLQFKHKLGLTEAQVSTIKEMRFEYQKKRIHFKAEKQIAKMEIDRLLHAKTMDESAIRAAGDKLINLKAQMIRAKIESKISLLKLLTEDQKRLSSKLYSAH